MAMGFVRCETAACTLCACAWCNGGGSGSECGSDNGGDTLGSGGADMRRVSGRSMNIGGVYCGRVREVLSSTMEEWRRETMVEVRRRDRTQWRIVQHATKGDMISWRHVVPDTTMQDWRLNTVQDLSTCVERLQDTVDRILTFDEGGGRERWRKGDGARWGKMGWTFQRETSDNNSMIDN